MANEVINFFARDACEINDGSWNSVDKTCSCATDLSGPFCLDNSAARDEGSRIPSRSISQVFVTIIGLIALVRATYAIIQKLRGHGKTSRSGKYVKVPYQDIAIN